MVDDLDIFRSAKLMVDLHGEVAAKESIKKADALEAKGDADGKVVWLRILEAVERLQSTVHNRSWSASAILWLATAREDS